MSAAQDRAEVVRRLVGCYWREFAFVVGVFALPLGIALLAMWAGRTL